MKIFILTLALGLGWTSIAFAQNCAPNNITTNPAAAVNNQRPSMKNTFNWTQPSFPLNLSINGVNATAIPSPFFSTDNTNILHLYDPFDGIKDVFPNQGWELIKKDNGYNNAGQMNNPGTTMPYLILYNKYRGVLRVMVARGESAITSGASLRISFPPGSNQSSLLDFNAPIRAVEEPYVKDPFMVSIVEFLNLPLKWFYADFLMNYDPCTCLYSSGLAIRIVTEKTSNIVLTGTSNGELRNLAQNGTPTDNAKAKGTSGIGEIGSSKLKKSIDVYKNSTLYSDEIKKAIDPSPLGAGAKVAKKDNLNKFQGAIRDSKFLKNGLKYLPYIGDAISFLDVFLGGGKQASGPTQVEIMPMSIKMSHQFTGTIKDSIPYGSITFRTPGSNIATNVSDSEYPFYNEALGVFSLLKTPKVFNSISFQNIMDENFNFKTITTYKYRFSNLLEYVLNPAAQMDIQEIQAALVIENGMYIPNSGQTSAPSFFPNFEGINITNNKHLYRTDYVDLNCLSKYVYEITTSSDFDEYNWDQSGNMYIKLMVNLKRKDATANTQNVLFAARYPIKLVDNNDVGQTDNDLTTCSTLPLPAFVSKNDVHTFCGTTTYKKDRIYNQFDPEEGTRNLLRMEQERERALKLKNTEGSSLEIYPNPIKENLAKIKFKITQSNQVNISLIDFSGRLMHKIVDNKPYESGDFEIDFDAKNYSTGIYFIKIEIGDYQITKKLIIQK